jgi:hypothetical protein
MTYLIQTFTSRVPFGFSPVARSGTISYPIKGGFSFLMLITGLLTPLIYAHALILSHKLSLPNGRAVTHAQVRTGLRGHLRLSWLGGLFALLAAILLPYQAFAVRPFVTDDARVVYPGQLETESWVDLRVSRSVKPAWGIHSLQGASVSDRLEIIAGWEGIEYQDRRIHLSNLVFQPKYLLYRSFGAIPSVSVAAAVLAPIGGNRQLWNNYSIVHFSWFLDTPEGSTDPYDNGLAIHLNVGMKSQYNAGPTRYSSKPYWAVGFEVKTPVSRDLRFLGEIFNGDPFDYDAEFPAFQTGLRWYKSPNVQWDVVYGGVRSPADVEGRPWDHTFQIGLRVVFDDVFPFR